MTTIGGFRSPRTNGLTRQKAVGYLRSPYQRGGTIIGGFGPLQQRYITRQTFPRRSKRKKNQRGGLYLPRIKQRGGYLMGALIPGWRKAMARRNGTRRR